MNNLTSEIKNLLDKKYEEESPRGLLVREYLLEQVTVDPLKSISEFENRKFNFKYFTGELLWYLCGDFTTQFIGKFSKFWDSLTNYNGLINSNYGQILLLAPSQFRYAYDALCKNKSTRQALMHINSPSYQFKETNDFPCTLNVLFYIRDNKLNMRVSMRSQDIFYGMQYDVPWFSFIQQNMFLLLKDKYPELELGKYTQMFDNVHFYERHFKLVDDIKKEKTTTYYNFKLLKPIIQINKNTVHSVKVDNYWLNEMFKFKNNIPENWQYSDWMNYLNNTGYFSIEKINE